MARGGKGGELQLTCCMGSSQDEHLPPCCRRCCVGPGVQTLPATSRRHRSCCPARPHAPRNHQGELVVARNISSMEENPDSHQHTRANTEHRPVEASLTPLTRHTRVHPESRDQLLQQQRDSGVHRSLEVTAASVTAQATYRHHKTVTSRLKFCLKFVFFFFPQIFFVLAKLESVVKLKRGCF